MMTDKEVLCPRCKKKTKYSKENVYRPFCSERCKVIDLGDWASENFRIPVSKNSEDQMNETEDTSDLQEE